MNRNFLKISLSVVLLVLALALCMTGCEVDDVKAELDTLKENVAADQAEVDAVIATLQAAVDTLKTNHEKDVAEKVAALNAAIADAKTALEAADAANKTALEAAIAAAKAELQAAVDATSTDLEEAIADLESKISANSTKIGEEVAALEKAIADAKTVLEAADTADKTALETAIATAKTELNVALEGVKTELLAKIEALEKLAKEENLKLIGEIDALKKELEESDVSNIPDTLKKVEAAIAENAAWIAKYKETTEMVVEALFGIEDVWDICNTYAIGWGEIATDKLLYAKEEAKVYLYRAANEDEVKAAVEKFYTAINELDTPELVRLRKIYDLLNTVKKDIEDKNLTDASEKLAAAREIFDEIGMDKCTATIGHDVLIVDGEAVDLSDVYFEYRLAVVSALIDNAEVSLDEKKAEDAIDTLKDVRTLLDEVKADSMTTVLDGVDLADRYEDTRVAVVKCYLNLANAAIEDATIKEDVDDTNDAAWVNTVNAENYTATISADGKDVTALTEAIADARDSFNAKYVDLYAAEIIESMNEYVGHLDAIYGDIEEENMEDVKADFTALSTHVTYSEYFGDGASDIVKELVETAAKLDEAITVRVALVALENEGRDVADIIDHLTVDGISGTKEESNAITAYKLAYKTFTDKLDEVYAEFEDNDAHKAVYDTIEALAEKDNFDAIESAFEEKIATLKYYGKKFIESVDALKSGIKDEFGFDTKGKIDTAKTARDAWLAQSSDVDSVAFVIEYCSEGTWTHSTLVKEIYDIEGAYNAWLVQAAAEWKAAYTDTDVGTLTVDNITIYENRLATVRAWFDKYPLGATEDIYGTETTYLWLTTLEARLVTLKNTVAAEAERVQGLIDLLKGDDTLTANRDEVVAARAAYNAWVAGTYSAGVNAGQIAITSDSAFDTVDIANLVASKTKLDALDVKISEIKGDIAGLDEVPTFDDMTKNYFADLDARNVYAATVAAIAEKIEAFKADNGDDLTVFTNEELKTVEDCKLYAEKYDSLVKLNSAYNDAKSAEGVDAATLSKFDSYYNDAIESMKGIHSESVFKDADGNVVTTTTPSIQIAIIGNNAEADLAAIANQNA